MGRQCLRIDFYNPKVKVFRWPSEKSYVMHETFVSPDQGLVTQVLRTKFSEPLTPERDWRELEPGREGCGGSAKHQGRGDSNLHNPIPNLMNILSVLEN